MERRSRQQGAQDPGSVLLATPLLRLRGRGAYLSLGDGLVGWAPDAELPAAVQADLFDWNRERPEVPCVVLESASEGGAVPVSPRQAGRMLLESASRHNQVSGVVISAGQSGLFVDVSGARGHVPRNEIPLRSLRHPAQAGAAWWGFVVNGKCDPAVLSGFEPAVRRQRGERRAVHLRALRVGSVQEGLVVAEDDLRAVVAFEEGLVFGVAPAGRIVQPKDKPVRVGRRQAFRVVTQFVSREASGAAELWLAPAGKQPALNARGPKGLPRGVADFRELPAPCPEWAAKAWQLLAPRERVMFALQHGLDGPRRSWRDLGTTFGFHSQHIRRIAMSAEDELMTAAGIPRSDWPRDTESRHKLLMKVLGLPRKPTATGARSANRRRA